MAKFPRDASKPRIVKALESLGFRLVREHEHISYGTGQRRWHADAVDHAESSADQRFDAASHLHAGGHSPERFRGRLSASVKITHH